jgi:predicted Ser/Thr protein kinase
MKLKCEWFTQVRGENPNTGEQVDEWGCAVTWLPMLLIENSQQQRQTGAAVESFRNETVNRMVNTILPVEPINTLEGIDE